MSSTRTGVHSPHKLKALIPVALLLSCASAPRDDSRQPAQTGAAAAPAPPPATSDAARQPTAALIIESRKLFVSNGAACEAWEVEIPNMLEENRGRLRRVGAGGPAASVEFERQGNDLTLEAPCFGEKSGVCLPCAQ